MRLEALLVRLDRVAAWASAAILVLYIVSGFGLTRGAATQSLTGGWMTPERAYTLHNQLYGPLLVTFAFHTVMGLRRALVRVTRRRALAGALAAGLGAVAVAYLALLGF